MNSHLLPLFISYRSSGEKLIKYQANSSCVIMSVILMTTLFYKALILQGEIWCWSLLGLKGLKRVMSRGYCFCSSLLCFCTFTLCLYPYTECSWRVMKKISNNFHQEALIITIYLVNFACIALKLEKVGQTTCISSFNPCPPLSTFAIEPFHVTSRRPYWCSKTMKQRPCWFFNPILWELICSYVNAFFCSNKFA